MLKGIRSLMNISKENAVPAGNFSDAAVLRVIFSCCDRRVDVACFNIKYFTDLLLCKHLKTSLSGRIYHNFDEKYISTEKSRGSISVEYTISAVKNQVLIDPEKKKRYLISK